MLQRFFQLVFAHALMHKIARSFQNALSFIIYPLKMAVAHLNCMQSLNGASKTVYIKGSKSRTDLVSPSYTFSHY